MGVKVREKVPGSGVWWIFVNHNSKRMSRQVGSKKAAEAAKQQIDARLALGQIPLSEKSNVPTVQDYYNDVFKPVYLESAVAKSTAASYGHNFKVHVLPALGAARLDEVGHDKMEEFVSDLVKKAPQISKKKTEEPQPKEKAAEKPRTLAKATIQSVVKQLSKFFNHARKRKLISENPASGLSQLYSQAPTKHEKIEPLTHEEVPLFLASSQKHASRCYALFLTAIQTGLRQGELAGLQPGDIDFNGKYLVVQRSIDKAHRKVVPTKTKKIRRVDLSDELIGVLKEHLRQQKEYWFKQGKPQPEWLFPNTEGRSFDVANVAKRYFHPCLAKAGLHRRRFHDLRHTYASLLLTDGAPIAYVSEQLGHASIQLTVKVYGHLQPGANRHWINNLPGAAATVVSAVAAD